MLNRDMLALIQKIQAGEFSRNLHFDAYRHDSVRRARRIYDRIHTIVHMLKTQSWDLEVSESPNAFRELTLRSNLLKASYRASLQRLEWDYLLQRIPDLSQIKVAEHLPE